MTRNSPKVTVIMPVYNAEPYLKRAMESILTQTYRGFEVLAVDDGSTDRSLDILQSFNDPRLRVMARPHSGVSATMDFALKEARGQLVARADADDRNLPERLEKQAIQINTYNDHRIAMCFGILKSKFPNLKIQNPRVS